MTHSKKRRITRAPTSVQQNLIEERLSELRQGLQAGGYDPGYVLSRLREIIEKRSDMEPIRLDTVIASPMKQFDSNRENAKEWGFTQEEIKEAGLNVPSDHPQQDGVVWVHTPTLGSFSETFHTAFLELAESGFAVPKDWLQREYEVQSVPGDADFEPMMFDRWVKVDLYANRSVDRERIRKRTPSQTIGIAGLFLGQHIPADIPKREHVCADVTILYLAGCQVKWGDGDSFGTPALIWPKYSQTPLLWTGKDGQSAWSVSDNMSRYEAVPEVLERR